MVRFKQVLISPLFFIQKQPPIAFETLNLMNVPKHDMYVLEKLCSLEIKPCGLKFENSRCLFLELQNKMKCEKLNI